MSLLPYVYIYILLYIYLISTASAYTHENLKAYKSLEAFNFVVCNHVQDVFYHSVSKKSEFRCLKTKVKLNLYDLPTMSSIFD